ncbi:MAG: YkgJ family cysteine cluster protein [Desulfovibrio sp.]|nr:YkgJ family cysteine cluster protein [Desulfovibrio sp.]
MDDASKDFLENLPELQPGATFCFDCNPEVPCFNQCCAELTLPLTPYDVLRLRRHMDNIASEAFLADFTTMRSFPDTGFPLPMLRMLQGPGEPCPFVTPGGCSVYEDRPGACRFYPLGRGTKMAEDGVAERFFVVREPHCHGFDKGTERTAQAWLQNEELAPYNAANDRYMRLMALVRATGKPLEPRMATMAVLCLFQLDKFRELITAMRIFAHVTADEARQQAVMEDSLAGDEAALDFALDWMELVIFGQCPRLSKK